MRLTCLRFCILFDSSFFFFLVFLLFPSFKPSVLTNVRCAGSALQRLPELRGDRGDQPLLLPPLQHDDHSYVSRQATLLTLWARRIAALRCAASGLFRRAGRRYNHEDEACLW